MRALSCLTENVFELGIAAVSAVLMHRRIPSPRGFMAGPLNRLYDRITDRFMRWRTLRWCTRLAKHDLMGFEEAILEALPDIQPIHVAGTSAYTDSVLQDLQLEAAILELSEQQQVLLSMLKQGATYRQIGAHLGLSDACALRALTALLCELAYKTSSVPSNTVMWH